MSTNIWVDDWVVPKSSSRAAASLWTVNMNEITHFSRSAYDTRNVESGLRICTEWTSIQCFWENVNDIRYIGFHLDFREKNKLEQHFPKIIPNIRIKNSRNPASKRFPTWQSGTSELGKHFWKLLRPRITHIRDSGIRIYSQGPICCALEHTTCVFWTEWQCTRL